MSQNLLALALEHRLVSMLLSKISVCNRGEIMGEAGKITQPGPS